jgi:parvulin-like peptidyl-prolyl isomerase
MLRQICPLVVLLAVAALTSGPAPAAQPTPTNSTPGAQPSPPSGDPLVAKGKSVEIRRSDLDKEVSAAKSQMLANGRPVKPDQIVAAERQVLEQLINVRLLESKATAADKAAGKDAALKRAVAAQTKLGSEVAYDAQLTLMGTTREAVLAKWTEALTAEAVLKREFNVKITDQEARKYYDENPTRFEAPDTVRASHILLSTVDPKTGAALPPDQKAARRKEAEALLKRARAGEDFAKLAREYSDDTVSKARGGEYTFAHGGMVPEVEAAAFAMSPNQIGDIVTSSYGYHIIKVSEKLPAHKVQFADAVAGIKDGLAQQAIEQQFPAYIATLRKEAVVEILDERLKPKEPGLEPIVAPQASTEKPGTKPAAK